MKGVEGTHSRSPGEGPSRTSCRPGVARHPRSPQQVFRNGVLLPYDDLYDAYSWRMSQMLLIYLFQYFYDGDVVRANTCMVRNPNHAAYPKVLTQEMVDEALADMFRNRTLMRGFRPRGKYKKAFPKVRGACDPPAALSLLLRGRRRITTSNAYRFRVAASRSMSGDVLRVRPTRQEGGGGGMGAKKKFVYQILIFGPPLKISFFLLSGFGGLAWGWLGSCLIV